MGMQSVKSLTIIIGLIKEAQLCKSVLWEKEMLFHKQERELIEF